MMKLALDLTGAPPFTLVRAITEAFLPAEPAHPVRAALRPVFHLDGTWARDDEPDADRVIREFRRVGWHLRREGCAGLRVSIGGPLPEVDLRFLEAIGGAVRVFVKHRGAAAGGPRAADPETGRVLDEAAHFGAPDRPHQWVGCARALSRYLDAGDPWTAGWLTGLVLETGNTVDPNTALLMALALLRSGNPLGAQSLAGTALLGSPLTRVKALHLLGMLTAWHLPRGLRDESAAAAMLDEGWQLLGRLGVTEDTRRERVRNRTGMALLLRLQGRATAACEVLDATLSESDGAALRATVLNSLGRAAAEVTTEPGYARRAEESLRAATELDQDVAEYWLDLGRFLARQGRYGEAVVATRTAAMLSDGIPEIGELLGLVYARLGRRRDAGEAYLRAVDADPGRQHDLLAAAREFVLAESVDRARHALDQVVVAELDPEMAGEFELLRLEVRGSLVE